MTLTAGSSGPKVRDLQEMLNVVVANNPLLVLDGIFGPKTREPVVAFQN
jgi:peptidoglycan hydrolase-like protein with peptidoglycan-binding domain